MNTINNIRAKQNQLIVLINATFDEIAKEFEELTREGNKGNIIYESLHPITNTSGFKGNKPTAVIIGERRVIAPTWKVVVGKILEEVIKDSEMKKRLLDLRDKLLGRVRTRLSSNSDEMRSPLELSKDLYIETHYDTETLMNLLLQVLNEISYDYNNIKIAIKN